MTNLAETIEPKTSVDEVIFFRGVLNITGWSFYPDAQIMNMGVRFGDADVIPCIGYGLPSPDVAAILGVKASHCRFEFSIKLDDPKLISSLKLVFFLANSFSYEVAHLSQSLNHDPYHVLQKSFFDQLGILKEGAALEIGSRNRSGNVRRDLLPPGFRYVGMDILPGDNVDVVGDVHALGEMFPANSFDAVFSISVFEHLLMPWKAVLELGKVLKAGGLVLIATHHTFPLHETPWDFFRFSDQAWHGLFNRASGFEIVQTALGEPAAVVPLVMHPVLHGLERCPAFIGSAVVARKIGESSLRWDVDIKSVIDTIYPV